MKQLHTNCACTDCTCEKPMANLTINKGRIKKYDKKTEKPTYYLKDGQEFEIELFNPKSNNILVKIKINGKLISQTGIVLKPGQRIFLDRYLDVAKKFKFETYEVADTKSVEKAINKNGDIEFLFYDELIFSDYNITWTNPWYNHQTLSGYNFGTPNTYLTNTNVYGNATTDNLTNLNCSVSTTTSNLSNNVSSRSLTSKPIKKLKSKKKETGRVEMGEKSNQTFKSVNLNFNSYTSHEISYKLLPISSKNIEIKDLKKYCTDCGAIMKKTYKFCAHCGTKA